jgi:hypothetical protein
MEGYLAVIDKNKGNIIRITDVFKIFKVKKRKKIKPTGFIVGTDNIYLSTNQGKLLIIDITTGNVSNIIKIDKSKIARPSIINKNMFIVTDNSIIRLN